MELSFAVSLKAIPTPHPLPTSQVGMQSLPIDI